MWVHGWRPWGGQHTIHIRVGVGGTQGKIGCSSRQGKEQGLDVTLCGVLGGAPAWQRCSAWRWARARGRTAKRSTPPLLPTLL